MSRIVRSFAQLESGEVDLHAPVVTLFSGGLDSTYLLLRLKELGAHDVHAVSVDVGDEDSHAGKQEIAAHLGARLVAVDSRSEFVDEYVAPALRAHAVYLQTHPVSSSLSRPLIAKSALRVAAELGARAVLHTANRSQNSLRRLNGAIRAQGFEGHYGSPYDLDPIDRVTKIARITEAGMSHMAERVVSGDTNLWCREYESGFLDDPKAHAMKYDLYHWTKDLGQHADERIKVTFNRGLPVALNDCPMGLGAILEDLNYRVGKFGYGRYSGLEHLDHGQKVLEVREMPAAWLLLRTLRHLEGATLTQPHIREKQRVEQIWVEEVLEGRWFSELRAAAQSFVDASVSQVSGSVTWSINHRSADTVSIVAEKPLYLRDRDVWEIEAVRAERSAYEVSMASTLAGSRIG